MLEVIDRVKKLKEGWGGVGWGGVLHEYVRDGWVFTGMGVENHSSLFMNMWFSVYSFLITVAELHSRRRHSTDSLLPVTGPE